MAEALMAELRGMKIPFFVIQRSLVEEPPSGAGDAPTKPDTAHGHAPVLTRSELAGLQRRMLGLLEDLCKE